MADAALEFWFRVEQSYTRPTALVPGFLRSFHPECRQLSRQMRLEEGMNLANRQGNPLFGLFPGEDAHFGFRREHRALDGDGVWVRGDLVRQHQDRVLATTHEIACHGEDKVRVGFEHPNRKLFGGLQW